MHSMKCCLLVSSPQIKQIVVLEMFPVCNAHLIDIEMLFTCRYPQNKQMLVLEVCLVCNAHSIIGNVLFNHFFL